MVTWPEFVKSPLLLNVPLFENNWEFVKVAPDPLLIVPSLVSEKPLLKEEADMLLIVPVLSNAKELLKVEFDILLIVPLFPIFQPFLTVPVLLSVPPAWIFVRPSETKNVPLFARVP